MTNHEKEKQPSKREKGTKDIKLLNTFREIWRALKEWLLTDKQKQELEGRKKELIDAFHKETDYGRETQEKNQKIGEVLEKARNELQGAPEKEFDERKKNAQAAIEGQRKEAQEHWKKEPKDLEEKYKDISEHELSETLREAEEKQKEIEREREEKREDSGGRRKRKRGNVPSERTSRMVTDAMVDAIIGGLPREEQKRIETLIRPFIEEGLGMRNMDRAMLEGESVWTLKKEEIEAIINRDEDEIEKIFNTFFETADAIPHMRFYEAMSSQERSRLSHFFSELLQQSRDKKNEKWTAAEGQRLIGRYSQEYVMRNLLHDAVFIVERGGGRPEQFKQFMAIYTSELHNFLFKAPGASEAARLWEKAFYRLLDEDGYVDYSRVCLSPEKTGRGATSEVEEWVYESLRKSLQLQEKERLGDKYSDEGFDDNWPEWKIRRAMALGKGHGIVTMRLVEIAAKGRLPIIYGADERMPSQWADNFVRTLDITEHLLEKFEIGGPALALLYTMVEGKPGNWSSKDELFFSLTQLTDPERKRIVDIYNLLKAGGPTTNSTWRGVMISEDISPEDLEKQGTLYRLIVGEYRKEQELRNNLRSQFGVEGKSVREKREIGKEIDKMLEDWKNEGDGFKYREKVWEDALKRNPLQVLREYATLDQRKERAIKDEVLREFLRRRGREDEFERIKFSSDSKDVRRARREFLDPILRQIDLAQERAVEKKTDRLDLSVIEDEELRRQAEAWLEAIREVIDKEAIEGLAKAEFRAGLGTDDVDWTKFDFSKTGPSGFIDRRSRDLANAEQAGIGLGEFLDNFARYRNEKEMAKYLDDLVLKPIRGYSPGVSSGLAEHFYQGICKFNDTNRLSKLLPEPLYSLYDRFFVNSAAEAWLGNDAPAWGAWDKRELFEAMRATGSFRAMDPEKFKEIEKKLRRQVGADWLHILGEASVRFHVLILAFIIYAIWKEIEKGIEETAEAA